MPRSTWYYHQKQKIPYEEKYDHVRPILEEILWEHPSYGIPRITPELSERYGRRINHNVVLPAASGDRCAAEGWEMHGQGSQM